MISPEQPSISETAFELEVGAFGLTLSLSADHAELRDDLQKAYVSWRLLVKSPLKSCWCFQCYFMNLGFLLSTSLDWAQRSEERTAMHACTAAVLCTAGCLFPQCSFAGQVHLYYVALTCLCIDCIATVWTPDTIGVALSHLPAQPQQWIDWSQIYPSISSLEQ